MGTNIVSSENKISVPYFYQESVLNSIVLKKVIDECIDISLYNIKVSNKDKFWFPTVKESNLETEMTEPRFFTEALIHILKKEVKTHPNRKIIGAEWSIQNLHIYSGALVMFITLIDFTNLII